MFIMEVIVMNIYTFLECFLAFMLYSFLGWCIEVILSLIREKKFVDLNSYINYVNSLNYSTYELSQYYVDNKGGNKIFGVYDNNGNLFVFKTNGVMQYTVYLDDYTVEI